MRKIALVGFAKSGFERIDNLPDDVELWTLNHAHKFDFRIDRLFEIHWREMLEDENCYDEETRTGHLNFLKAQHDFPIYMQETHPDFPASVEYPKEAAIELAKGKRFESSIAWMAALAMIEKVDQVEIIGIEMTYETEYRYQKPNALYWIGRMEGAGIEVIANELMPERKLYGYEAAQVVSRHTLEEHKRLFGLQADEHDKQLNYWRGVRDEAKKNGKNTMNADTAVRNYEMTLVKVQGAIESLQHLIDVCDLKEVNI